MRASGLESGRNSLRRRIPVLRLPARDEAGKSAVRGFFKQGSRSPSLAYAADKGQEPGSRANGIAWDIRGRQTRRAVPFIASTIKWIKEGAGVLGLFLQRSSCS